MFYLAANYFPSFSFLKSSSQTAIISETADSNGIVIEYLVSSSNSMLQILDGTSKKEMVQTSLQQFWDNWQIPMMLPEQS